MINSEEIATNLGNSSLCIVPDFLSPALIQAVLIDLNQIKNLGLFTQAGTGQGKAREIHNLIRRDQIFWLDEISANPVQLQLWKQINSLKQAFNRVLYLGLREFEGHYASYPQGGFYKKHIDSFQRDHSRVVTVIIYLNQCWQSKDGGILRVYANGQTTDIKPIAGTLVCFLSHELEHEVLLSHTTRLSLSGWFKN